MPDAAASTRWTTDVGVALRPPADLGTLPPYAGGWLTDEGVKPYLPYVQGDFAVNWSAELEELHEESSRDHFIDVWTRGSMLARLGTLAAQPVIVDLGCSTGHLLEDLQRAHPDALLVGVDLVANGLTKAHVNVPRARLLQADVCDLPLADASVDAAVSANLLEHVPDDRGALSELFRVLRPGGQAAIVVPAGPHNYDYYDRFLGHERRYAAGELAGKAQDAGLEIVEDAHLGSVLYPAFWLVKQRNRRSYGHLQGLALQQRVEADIASTSDSRLGHAACRIERLLLDRGVRPAFGIRGLTVVRRPNGAI
jgi:SAM-dependent methyltransferase